MSDQNFLQEENERLKKQIEMMDLQIKGYEECIGQMKGSISWKVTEPLRFCKEKCTPLREGVNLIKNMKKMGFSKALQQSKIEKAAYKQPYRPKLFSFEQREQKEKAKEITIAYHVVLFVNENHMENLCDAIKSIANQSVMPADIFLIVQDSSSQKDSISKEIAFVDTRNIPIEIMKRDEFEAVSNNMKDTDCLLVLTPDVLLTQGCIYELEMDRLSSGADMIYGDDVLLDGKKQEYRFKPDFAPHYLLSENYIGNFVCMNVKIWKQIVEIMDLSQWENQSVVYRILLFAKKEWKISHISKIISGMKVSEETLKNMADKELLSRNDFIKKYESGYVLEQGLVDGSSHVLYKEKQKPLVSILIPSYDHVEDLDLCIRSIKEKTTYSNIEIIVIENNSKNKETFDYYQKIEKEGVCVLYWDREFNYSAINNFAVKKAKGEYVLLLNNDIEILTPNWIEEMLTYAGRDEVGAVGAKLFFPDKTIQHAGVVLGIRRLAGHVFRGMNQDEEGYLHRTMVVQDYSLVTAACLLIKKDKFLQCGGFDERLAVDFNDVDLCMKLRGLGYYNVFTPYAQMIHYESKSRGGALSPETKARKEREFYYFNTKWYQEIIKGDPFYNKNLTLSDDSFSRRKKKEFV
ncbi:MAG: glycosyltransferase [Lachnospiraceae bacterium]